MQVMIKPWLTSISLLIIGSLLLATMDSNGAKKAKKFFPGCHQLGYTYDRGHLVLEPVQVEDYDQTLYFIHNNSSSQIKIQYYKSQATLHYPLWETSVRSDRWAAFATDKVGLQFQCLSGYGNQVIDCSSVLQVCQFPRAKFAEHNRGNYWITSNRSKYSSRNAAIRKGILLRW